MKLFTIDEYLVRHRFNQTKAAEELKLNRGTFGRYVRGVHTGVIIEEDDGSVRLYGRVGDKFSS